jgi:hypothetical protein
MGEAAWFVAREIGGNAGTDAVVRVGAASVAGIAVYVAILMLVEAPELGDIRRQARPGVT